MIKRLHPKNNIDIFEFVNRVSDKFNDFYITVEKERKFIRDLYSIEKILKRQEVFAVANKEIDGLLMIYREKGFRPYVKILAKDSESQRNLIKFLIWNYSNQDLFIKVKKINPLAKLIQRYGFIFQGDRGEELLLFRKGEKIIKKVGDKDEQYNS